MRAFATRLRVADVTAYCNPKSWTTGTDTHVVVQCCSASGAATDSAFHATLGTAYGGYCL